MNSLILFLSLLTTIYAEESIPEKSKSLLIQLSEINSSTENTKGLDEVRKLITPEFEKLGFKKTISELPNERKVLIFDVEGSSPHIGFIGHLDTVFPLSSPFQKVQTNGSMMNGPGVIDMKGGLVMMLDILQKLSPEERKRVRIILNDDEEIGSTSSRDELKKFAQNLKYGLVFEPGLPEGQMVTSASGVYWLEITATGKASHAGTDFYQGLNACVALSEVLSEISKFSNPKKNLTVNVGFIIGGLKPNVVCEKASAKVDIRYIEPKVLEETLAKIKKSIAKKHAVNPITKAAPVIEMNNLINVPSLTQKSSHKLFKRYREEAKKLGQDIRQEHASFASDANQLSPLGIELMVGFGAYGGKSHTVEEFLDMSTYPGRLALNVEFIKVLIRE